VEDHHPWNLTGLPNWGRESAAEVAARDLTRDEFLATYVARWRPVVIRGACRHWPAVAKWRDREYLRQRWGDAPIPIHVRAKPLMTRHPDARRSFRDGVISGTLRDLLEDDPSEPDRSLRYWPLREGGPLAGMLDDLEADRLVADQPPPRLYARRRLFLYRGGISVWHLHGTDEHLTYQLVGTKRFALVSPDQHVKIARAATTELYSLDATPRDYPEYFSMVPLSCELQAGDAIYIPPLWWHTVQPIDKELGATLAFTWGTPLLAYARNWRRARPVRDEFMRDPLFLWRPTINAWRRRIDAVVKPWRAGSTASPSPP
jgi:hypothetical protein